jgi:hypothetical protein
MRQTAKQFDFVREPIQASGRYCSEEYCMNPAVERIQWSELYLIGHGRRKQRYACKLHSTPAQKAVS